MKLTILLQGASSSGKSQLICWHTTNQANPDTLQTIEESHEFLEDFQGRKVLIEILDTGGDPNYISLLEDWVSRANAQILVINLEDTVSIEYLREHKNILSATNILARVVVGNLPSGKQENRIVTQEAAKKLASDLGSQVYLETNTWTGEGVNKVFSALMDRVYGQSKSEMKIQPSAAITANSSNVITTALTSSNITNAPINITAAAPVPPSKTESMTVHVSTSDKDAEISLLKTRQAELEFALAAQEKLFSSRLQSVEGKLLEITTAYQKLQEQAFAARLEALEALVAHQKEELGMNKLVKAGSEIETPAKLKPAHKQIGDVGKQALFTTPS